MERRYKNLGIFFLLIIPLVLFGFSKTYLAHLIDIERDIDMLIHVHFLITAIWILMLVVQPMLIRFKRYQEHKLVGRLSYFVFPLVLLSFIPLYLKQFEYNFLPLVVLTTFDILLACLFYALAIMSKAKPKIHMRYMVLLALVFVMPAVGRINSHWLGFSFVENMNIGFFISFSLVVWLITLDKLNSYDFRPYLLGLFALTVKHLAILIAM